MNRPRRPHNNSWRDYITAFIDWFKTLEWVYIASTIGTVMLVMLVEYVVGGMQKTPQQKAAAHEGTTAAASGAHTASEVRQRGTPFTKSINFASGWWDMTLYPANNRSALTMEVDSRESYLRTDPRTGKPILHILGIAGKVRFVLDGTCVKTLTDKQCYGQWQRIDTTTHMGSMDYQGEFNVSIEKDEQRLWGRLKSGETVAYHVEIE